MEGTVWQAQSDTAAPAHQVRNETVVSAERDLSTLRRAGLTPAGENYVIAVSDLFHDESFDVNGKPDFRTDRTITQMVQKLYKVKAPAGGNPWSFAVFNLPFNQTIAADTGSGAFAYEQYGDCVYADFLSHPRVGSVGSVTVAIGADGVQMYPNAAAFQDSSVNYTGLSPSTEDPSFTYPDSYTAGLHRIIAMAFEVHDTSAPLYQAGDCVMFRQPDNRVTEDRVAYYTVDEVNYPNWIQLPIPFVNTRGPPVSMDAAINMPGSTLSAAKHGVYMVCVPYDPELPFTQSTSQVCLPNGDDLAPGNFNSGISPANAAGPNVPYTRGLTQFIPNTISGDTFGLSVQGQSFNQFHTSGAYFGGLNPNQTFTVVARFLIERAPTVSQPDLVVLARPSPPADEICVRILSEMFRKCPVGCQVRDNKAGDWFKNAVSVVAGGVKKAAKVALPVASELALNKARMVAKVNPKAAAAMAAYDAIADARRIAKDKKKLKRDRKRETQDVIGKAFRKK